MSTEGIEDFGDLAKRIPKGWRDCPIGIAEMGGEHECWDLIKRVSLQEHADGSRVVLFHRRKVRQPDQK